MPVKTGLILGIAGGTGSGKTTIAHRIVEALGPAVVCIDHDAYYKDLSHVPASLRTETNFDHPDALENDLLIAHLRALRCGQSIQKPVYDFTKHVRSSATCHIDPAPVVVVEGILCLAVEALRALMDIRVFVDTDADIRLIRRIRRDLEQRGRSFADVRAQYYDTVRPMHLAFVEPSKRHADVIIPEGGRNAIAIDVLVGRIRSYLDRGEAPKTSGAPEMGTSTR